MLPEDSGWGINQSIDPPSPVNLNGDEKEDMKRHFTVNLLFGMGKKKKNPYGLMISIGT